MRVSVAMITFNHEAYIAQAIESVLMQETTFAYELVIGEDCSTDQTRAIVAAYAAQYPTKIRALFHTTNLGGRGKCNFVATTKACQGEYIAVLEGDDYWTAPDKLQKQVEFLDTHPDFALCFHNVRKVDESALRPPTDYCNLQQQELTIDELLLRNVIPTCSVMYRRGLVAELPAWYYELPIGDWPIWLLHAQQGKLGYLPATMGVYRIHHHGMWSGETVVEQVLTLARSSAIMGLQFGYAPATLLERGLPIWVDRLSRDMAREIRSTQVTEIDQPIQSLLQRWPAALALSPKQSRWFLGKLYMNLARAFDKRPDPSAVRHCLYQALRHDPTWLGHRRFWSLVKRTVMSRKAAAPSTKALATVSQPKTKR